MSDLRGIAPVSYDSGFSVPILATEKTMMGRLTFNRRVLYIDGSLSLETTTSSGISDPDIEHSVS